MAKSGTLNYDLQLTVILIDMRHNGCSDVTIVLYNNNQANLGVITVITDFILKPLKYVRRTAMDKK